MELEKELRKLKNSEVENMEETIKKIEDCKYDINKILDKREIVIKEYENRIKEKLPVMIDNLFILWGDIPKKMEFLMDKRLGVGLRKICNGKYGDILEITYYKCGICLSQGNKKYPGDISLFSLYGGANHLVIKEKNSVEFAKKFSSLSSYMFSEEKGRDYSSFLDLPTVLSKIPQEITKSYSKFVGEYHSLNKKIKSYSNQLNALQTTDF